MKPKSKCAVEYLERIRKIDTLINNKLRERQNEVQRWLDIALNVTPSVGGERVQSSGNPQKTADAIGNYIDIERRYDTEIDALIDEKQGIIADIELLPEAEYDVLHKRYVQYKEYPDLYSVAAARNIEYSTATAIHGRALAQLWDIVEPQGNI